MSTENNVPTSTDTPNDAVTSQSSEQTLVDKFYATSTAEGDKLKAEEGPKDESEKPEAEQKDDKAPEPEKKKEDGELKYELKVPEGSSLSEESVKEIEAFAKEHAITPEAAQKLLEREDSILKTFVEAQFEIAKNQSLQWQEQVKADKILGGENIKQTAFYAEKALSVFGDKEIRTLLQESGYGNHPAAVRFFRKVGLSMAPDTFEKGGGMPVEKKSVEEILYGSKK